MSETFGSQESGDTSNDPRLWKVEPGFALGILQLGMPRHELFQVLKERDFDTEDADLQESEFYLMEMDTTLCFGLEHPYLLELIEVNDDRARFGTLKVLGDYRTTSSRRFRARAHYGLKICRKSLADIPLRSQIDR